MIVQVLGLWYELWCIDGYVIGQIVGCSTLLGLGVEHNIFFKVLESCEKFVRGSCCMFDMVGMVLGMGRVLLFCYMRLVVFMF